MLYYLKLMVTPVDQLLSVALGTPTTFTARMYKDRLEYWRVLQTLKRCHGVHVTFDA